MNIKKAPQSMTERLMWLLFKIGTHEYREGLLLVDISPSKYHKPLLEEIK